MALRSSVAHVRAALIAAALTLALAPPMSALAGDARAIGWGDLADPAAARFEDPFGALGMDQLVALRRILQLDGRLAAGGLSAAARARLEMARAELEAALAADGVDADALLATMAEVAERRRLAGLAVNPALDGATVTLEGFAFAGPPLGDGRRTAYVVEAVGMCSHFPPPQPNRLVRVVLPEAAEVSGDYVPVAVTGRLEAEATDAEVFVVDGWQALSSAVMIEARRFETAGAGGGEGALRAPSE